MYTDGPLNIKRPSQELAKEIRKFNDEYGRLLFSGSTSLNRKLSDLANRIERSLGKDLQALQTLQEIPFLILNIASQRMEGAVEILRDELGPVGVQRKYAQAASSFLEEASNYLTCIEDYRTTILPLVSEMNARQKPGHLK